YKLLAALLCVGLFTACREQQEEEITPTSDFSYTLAERELKNVLSVYPVNYGIQTINTSSDAVSYLWDFGDGNTSDQKSPSFSYAKSGNYTITLTTTSATGKQQVSVKPIRVVDQVLKKITVSQLNWNAFGKLPGWTGTKQADLIFEIGQRNNLGSPVAINTTFYRSEPRKNTTNTTTAFEIPVSQKVVLNTSAITGPNGDLLINLYGNDGTANQLVYSTGGSGIGMAAYFNRSTNYYTFESNAFGTSITLECGFE
ncbi:MAG: PKD domain-containing protein, partial [Cytophagaceae bacterium]